MSSTDKRPGKTHQPSLAELMASYLERQTAVQGEGLGTADSQEVVPHEAGPIQPIDPKLAWTETLEVLPFYSAQNGSPSLQPPPDWPALVAGQEPYLAVAFCLGNFPQLIRNLQPLLHVEKKGSGLFWAKHTRRTVPAKESRPLFSAETANQHRFPQCLLAAASLRLAKQFDDATAMLSEQTDVPAEWKPAFENERAALAWHQGKTAEALKMWQSQDSSLPVLFNRGMASLFLNKRQEARSSLNQAVAQIPETSSWHHLGRLYLALAEMGD